MRTISEITEVIRAEYVKSVRGYLQGSNVGRVAYILPVQTPQCTMKTEI